MTPVPFAATASAGVYAGPPLPWPWWDLWTSAREVTLPLVAAYLLLRGVQAAWEWVRSRKEKE